MRGRTACLFFGIFLVTFSMAGRRATERCKGGQTAHTRFPYQSSGMFDASVSKWAAMQPNNKIGRCVCEFVRSSIHRRGGRDLPRSAFSKLGTQLVRHHDAGVRATCLETRVLAQVELPREDQNVFAVRVIDQISQLENGQYPHSLKSLLLRKFNRSAV